MKKFVITNYLLVTFLPIHHIFSPIVRRCILLKRLVTLGINILFLVRKLKYYYD